ncbi:MAG: response regulator transcription factor [Deltaproteobacteria bacterium]|nr:response regulator transcription factor [Deltaproteobacteria bacterium]
MPKRVLFIDDEKDFTELTKTILGFHDFAVDTTNDPETIGELLSQNQYDIIITDLMMPGVNGFEVIRRLRAMENYQATPAIVLSAKTLSDEERKMLLQNKAHFMAKPFEPNDLVEKINALLE